MPMGQTVLTASTSVGEPSGVRLDPLAPLSGPSGSEYLRSVSLNSFFAVSCSLFVNFAQSLPDTVGGLLEWAATPVPVASTI